ncbi:flagellar hook-associated protein FlgL [Clostridium uliginosum]|uniref:Flagellar hook-associated protein 3 FlgL n=1 Tax=Clostridium uliginosum TaxID=119641 RepID=A0A1I1KP89_9CLOT|nr:flagellar hook-associated protein FlgL [Clostridium uliginosum]SFC60498.1 flagellar hook-associated protein 3 FlgL [Clostridium uliginosum]
MQRITTSMLSSNYLSNMKMNLNNMQTLQSQLSSGKEINKPSDNPYKASRSMQLHSEITANKQYNENIKDTTNWLDTTDTALGQAGNVFGRVRELLVLAGNGAYGVNEKKAIQAEIKQKVNQVSEILNTNFDGAYIFGGTKSTSKPVMVNDNGELCYADKDGNAITNADDGMKIDLSKNPINSSIVPKNNKSIGEIVKDKVTNKVTITINDSTSTPPAPPTNKVINLSDVGTGTPPATVESLFENTLAPTAGAEFTTDDVKKALSSYNSLDQINANLNVEVSQGVLINYNKTATDVMQGNGTNIMDTLNKIIYNLNPSTTPIVPPHTEAPDISKITGECIKEVDDITNNLLEKRSQVGAMTNRMESAQSNNEAENLNMTDILSKTEDIDFTQKMMEYSVMQTIYMASLQTSAKVLPTTILDYLR